MPATKNTINDIVRYLGKESSLLLDFTSQTIPKNQLHKTGPGHIDEVFVYSDRNPRVLRNLNALYNTGRLAGTGLTLP